MSIQGFEPTTQYLNLAAPYTFLVDMNKKLFQENLQLKTGSWHFSCCLPSGKLDEMKL